jgi:bacillithiol biosynthesis cysteine-adding enzyme BshC
MSTSPAKVIAPQLPDIETSSAAASPFLDAYLGGDPRLAPFFAAHPADIEAYHRKAREVDGRLDARARQRVGEALRPLSAAATHRLGSVLQGDGYFVTTGQQTGLFTGPLYTIVKALSAMRLARALEARLERPVVALFWCAADDHDWAEVNHVHMLDARSYVQRIALRDDAADAPPLAMSHRVLGTEVQLAIDALADLLPDSAFRAARLGALRAAYAPGRTMAAAFEDALADVLAGQDIVLVSSAHPLMKQHSLPVLRRALADAPAQEVAVAEQSARLESAGFRPQVSVATGASNVFRQDAQGRDRLMRDRRGWLLRRSRRSLGTETLLRELEQQPMAFSPNVLLRPIVESALFPTLAYVGGPAETGYFAQIGCLFRTHGIEPPLVYPRATITLVEGHVEKTLGKFSLASADLRRPFEVVVANYVRAQMPGEVTGALDALRTSLGEAYARVAEAAERIDPTLQGPVTGARNRALAHSREIEKRIERGMQHRSAVTLEQLRKAATSVFPRGAPQERVLNVYPFLARYGAGLIPAMLEALPEPVLGARPEGWDGLQCAPSGLPLPLHPE